ncbi:hypothetical protein CEUSTIGMA_g6013.t1 [Chlamydomonas eustigma]|uniref:Uncharacterized protein n=1 Tax=Chlamydomonas eustigma TaxID=1157962 RepID=A0A250X666_9CHLO|nr:hypothetical protein CEUSTIGMA_g6013.t1 [Chlamydomonas eustigma]|eukprot:GAX78573.1 hypothetical protein CEUSTIGMA_g6013.t1 [Chlamydomonas eustigma]
MRDKAGVVFRRHSAFWRLDQELNGVLFKMAVSSLTTLTNPLTWTCSIATGHDAHRFNHHQKMGAAINMPLDIPRAIGGNQGLWKSAVEDKKSLGVRLYTQYFVQRRSFASKVKIEYVTIHQPLLDPCLTEPTNYLQLMSALRQAPNAKRIEELMKPEMLARYDSIHVAAALCRLPKVLEYREKDMVKTDVVMPEGCGVLSRNPRPGSELRLSNRQKAQSLSRTLCMLIPSFPSERFQVRQAANCIWALGTLHKKGVKVVDSERMERRLLDKMNIGGSKAGGVLLPGMEMKGDMALKDMISDLVQRMVNSNMSLAFVNAYASLLRVIAAKDFKGLHKHALPCEVAQLLKGMAMLPRSCQQYDVVTELMMYVAKRGDSFEARELGTAAWAIAALSDARENNGLRGLEAAGAALYTLARCCIKRKEEFLPSAIATVMWSFAACRRERQLVPAESIQEMCGALVEGIEPQLVLLKPQDIAMLTWACAELKYKNQELMQLMIRKAVQLLESFTPFEMSQTLLATARNKHPASSSARLFMAVTESVPREVDPSLGLRVVSDTMLAFAQSGLDTLSNQPWQGWLEKAQAMLRRLRGHLKEGISDRRLQVTPELAAKMGTALMKLHNTESRLGLSAPRTVEDAGLEKALMEVMEDLAPSSTPYQLAEMMNTVARGFKESGLMLAAAGAARMKQLITDMSSGPSGKIHPRASDDAVKDGHLNKNGQVLLEKELEVLGASWLLRHAADVHRVCIQLGVNNTELRNLVEGLLVASEEAMRERREDKHGLRGLSSKRVLSVLLSCHHDEPPSKLGQRHQLRSAVSRLLRDPQRSSPAASDRTTASYLLLQTQPVLVRAMSIFAAGADACNQVLLNKPKSGRSVASVPESSTSVTLHTDLDASEYIAGILNKDDYSLQDKDGQLKQDILLILEVAKMNGRALTNTMSLASKLESPLL